MLKLSKSELKYLEMLLELNIKTLYLSTLDERNQPVLDKFQETELELNCKLLFKVKMEQNKATNIA